MGPYFAYDFVRGCPCFHFAGRCGGSFRLAPRAVGVLRPGPIRVPVLQLWSNVWLMIASSPLADIPEENDRKQVSLE